MWSDNHFMGLTQRLGRKSRSVWRRTTATSITIIVRRLAAASDLYAELTLRRMSSISCQSVDRGEACADCRSWLLQWLGMLSVRRSWILQRQSDGRTDGRLLAESCRTWTRDPLFCSHSTQTSFVVIVVVVVSGRVRRQQRRQRIAVRIVRALSTCFSGG